MVITWNINVAVIAINELKNNFETLLGRQKTYQTNVIFAAHKFPSHLSPKPNLIPLKGQYHSRYGEKQ